MPWEHCGRQLTDDDLECPQCHEAKGTWTVNFEVTRNFRVGSRRTLLKVQLLTSDELPVADEPCELRFSDGSPAEPFQLDANGAAKLERAPGAYVLAFPDRPLASVRLEPGTEGEPLQSTDVAAFTWEVGKKLSLRTCGVGVIHMQLLDGITRAALADTAYDIVDADTERLVCSGVTDADGILLHDPISAGDYLLRAEGHDPVAAVVIPAEREPLVRLLGRKAIDHDATVGTLRVRVENGDGTPQEREPFAVFVGGKWLADGETDADGRLELDVHAEVVQLRWVQRGVGGIAGVGQDQSLSPTFIGSRLSEEDSRQLAPIRRGDLLVRNPRRGAVAKALQRALTAVASGAYALEDDGYFYGDSEAALLQFQRDEALEDDGVVGPQTCKSLDRRVGCGCTFELSVSEEHTFRLAVVDTGPPSLASARSAAESGAPFMADCPAASYHA